MSRSVAFYFAAVSLLATVPSSARALEWSLGTHVQFSALQSTAKHSGSSTVIAWPASAFAYQPAIRIACGDSRRANELLLDSGLFYVDEAGSALSLFAASASAQHAFAADRPVSAFVNAGAGLLREGGAARTATTPSYGGGFGVRRRVGGNHGALRAELRVDYLGRDQDGGRPSLVTYGLRLGFDLWP